MTSHCGTREFYTTPADIFSAIVIKLSCGERERDRERERVLESIPQQEVLVYLVDRAEV